MEVLRNRNFIAKMSIVSLLVRGTKLEQKHTDLGLSYNCLILILSSYIYLLNFAQVSFFWHSFST